MDIATTTARAPTVSTTAAPTEKSAASISSDFDTFLRMLTTQITNQDPLNPMNAEEFAVQLATFSGVEQQVRTNDLLEGLGASLGQSSLGEMAGWVGLDVRAAMPVHVSGDPVEVTIPAPIAGGRHDLVVTDRYGSEARRIPVDPTDGTFEWNAMDRNGVPVAPGLYSVTLESFDGENLVATAPAETYAPVREVRSDPQGIVLVFDGGVERFGNSVSALRQHGFSAT